MSTPLASSSDQVRVAIVGTGFSGLGMAIQLKRRGIDDFVVLERADDAGGTWRDNTYPGCACDVPSHLYSFSFARNPDWSRTFGQQREIWDYLRACVDRFGIAPHLRYGVELQAAEWDDAGQCWRLTTSQGPLTATVLVMGNGPLSEPSLPPIPGIEGFTGTLFHSAQWRHDHDLTGEHVAVIGTGASAIQFIPHVQPHVARLTLYQRTPPWIVPRLDRPIPAWQRALFHAFPPAQWLKRGAIYAQREIAALALVYRPQMMDRVQHLSLRHLEHQVADPDLRAKLTPTYRMGCKRILVSDDFYPALSQPNAELVTERIQEVRAGSIITADGTERPTDTIILATGFHVTDMPAASYVRGQGGQTLADAWRDGPQAYLGTAISGFPNLFLVIGPNTGLGHTSMVYMIESQLAYILDALRLMDRLDLAAVDVRPEAQADFNDEVQQRMRTTVWTSGCMSWYLDAHGRNTTLWPGFTWEFRRRTRRFDSARYALTPRVAAPVGGAILRRRDRRRRDRRRRQ